MDRVPETRFARSGERRIAYQVAGEGPVDLVFRGSWFLPVDAVWEWEPSAAFRGRLASFSRLIMFDRPGAGATDPLPPGGASEVEAWSDDLLAVLDEIGSTRAALLGSLDGGLFAIVFAANHPERTSALVLGETTAYAGQVPGYPGGIAAPPGQDGRSLWESWGSTAIRDGLRGLGLTVRAGLHTGEVELMGDKVGGIAVHTGARVSAQAGPGEVLVSRTVVDLVAGSGITFEDRGEHRLKGVPGSWRLFAVTS
jgi:pimeloyl-ACP methyl ester carboxylesterase